MELKVQTKKEAQELSKEIKNLLLIYDHIRTSNKNIDEFNPSKIVLTEDIKQKDLKKLLKIQNTMVCRFMISMRDSFFWIIIASVFSPGLFQIIIA